MTLSPSLLATMLFAATSLPESHSHFSGNVIPTNAVTYTAYEQYATTMLAAVNKQRATQGLPPLCLNNKLHKSAQAHSEDMAAHDFMGHVGSDGATMSDRITRTTYDWTAVAENVAAGQANVDDVMVAWIHSPEHLENIMGEYTMFACGYAFNLDGSFQHYWTQHFGSSDTEACDGIGTQTVPEATPTVRPVQGNHVPEALVPVPAAILGTNAPATEAPVTSPPTLAPVPEAVTPAPMGMVNTNAPVTEAPVTFTPTPPSVTEAVTPVPVDIINTNAPVTEAPVTFTPTPALNGKEGKDCESSF